MTKQRLYPFPRIPARAIEWGDWSARIDGNQTSHLSLAEEWDSNCELVLAISVRLRPESLADLGIQNPKLTLTVTCPSTAFAAHADAELLTVSSSESASAELRIAGSRVSQMLIIRTEIIGDDQSNRLLRRRILAEGPALRIPLDTELDGFPTSSYSFDKRGIPEAPWRLVVSADELEAPFAHSIRLELNEDFSSVRKLIDGKPEPHVVRELDAAIVRVLIATAARLSAGPARNLSPDEIAAEFPESIAAAAQRAAEQYLQLTLAAAVKSYRLTPERHEYEVSSGTKLLKD